MTAIRKLEIRIDQTGSASKGIAGIAGSVGKIAKVGLVAGAAAVAGVALLTAGIVKVGASLVTAGSNAEEMMGKFDVVFGSMAGPVTDQLKEFGDKVGRGKYELMGMASSIQDLLVPMGFQRDAAAKMSVDMTKLAVDVASFNNVTDAQVQENFSAALIGSYEPIRKYGIIIDEARVKAKAMEMGLLGTTVAQEDVRIASEKLAIAQRKHNLVLAEHGEGSVKAAESLLRVEKAQKAVEKATEGTLGEIDQQSKALAIQQLIVEGSADAAGDAERTSGSWANQMRRLQSIVADTAADLGLKLLPVVTPLITKLGDLARDVMPIVIEKFTAFAENVLPVVIEKIGLVAGKVWEWAGAFKDWLLPKITAVWEFITNSLVPGIVSFYETTLTPAIAKIGEWANAFKDWLMPKLKDVWSYITVTLVPAVKDFYTNTIAPAIDKVGEWADTFKDDLLESLKNTWSYITETFVPAIKDFYNVTIPDAIEKFNEWNKAVEDWGLAVEKDAAPQLEAMKKQIEERIIPSVDNLKLAWSLLTDAFAKTGPGGAEEAVSQLSAVEVILWPLAAVVDAVTYLFEVQSAMILGWASIFRGIRGLIDYAIEGFVRFKEDLLAFAASVPDWLKPGSPTPFELGLKGIADAAKRVNLEMGGMGMAPMAGGGGGMAGGGGGITVNLTYSPAVSLADKYEAQQQLGPFIAEYLRKEGY